MPSAHIICWRSQWFIHKTNQNYENLNGLHVSHLIKIPLWDTYIFGNELIFFTSVARYWDYYHFPFNISKIFFPFSEDSPRPIVFFVETVAIKYAVCQCSSEVVNFDWILCYITTWHLTWKMTFCFTCQQPSSHQISEWEKFLNFNFLMLLDTTSSILKQFSSACTCFGIHAMHHTTCYYNSFFV